MEAGFFLRVFLRERRYANLGHLLPMFPIERAVKPGVSALPLGWPATSSLTRHRKVRKPLPWNSGWTAGPAGRAPKPNAGRPFFPRPVEPVQQPRTQSPSRTIPA